MESGATISTRRIRPACESAPVMAMVVSVFPVPGQPISMRSAAPLLEMFICTTSLADRGAGSWYALPERATPLNSSDRCSACPRPDDERPLRAAGACPAWLPPVSYTHLDVYKRQMPGRYLRRPSHVSLYRRTLACRFTTSCHKESCGSVSYTHLYWPAWKSYGSWKRKAREWRSPWWGALPESHIP